MGSRISPSINMQALLNQSLRSSVGTGAEVHGRSFGRWDKYDPNRIFLFQLLYNMYPCKYIRLYFIFVIVKHQNIFDYCIRKVSISFDINVEK